MTFCPWCGSASDTCKTMPRGCCPDCSNNEHRASHQPWKLAHDALATYVSALMMKHGTQEVDAAFAAYIDAVCTAKAHFGPEDRIYRCVVCDRETIITRGNADPPLPWPDPEGWVCHRSECHRAATDYRQWIGDPMSTEPATVHPSGRDVVTTDKGTFVQVGWSTRSRGGRRWKFNQMWEVGPKAGAVPIYEFRPSRSSREKA